MADDFPSAAIRLYRDAELLANSNCMDTAGHLIGFAAECAIKSNVASLTKGNAPRGHFPQLVNAARQSLDGRRHSAFLMLLNSRIIMNGWDVNNRYASDNHVTNQQYLEWRADTQALLNIAGLNR